MSTSLRNEVQQFHSEVTALQPRIEELASRVAEQTSQHITETADATSSALTHVSNLLTFICTARTDAAATTTATATAEPSPRVIGDLNSHVAHLYGRFAIAKGVGRDVSHTCASLSTTVQDLHTDALAPLVFRQTSLDERTRETDDSASEALSRAQAEQESTNKLATSKADAIAATEVQLKSLQTNLVELRAQIEALEAEKKILERKAALARERQRIQGAKAAAGFFSLFSFGGAAAAGGSGSGGERGKLVLQATDEIDEKITNLNAQCDGSDPAALESALADMRNELNNLDTKAQAVGGTLESLTTTAAFESHTRGLFNTAQHTLETHATALSTVATTVKNAVRRLDAHASRADAAAGGLVFCMHGLYTQELGYDGMVAEVVACVKMLLDVVNGEDDQCRDVVETCRALLDGLNDRHGCSDGDDGVRVGSPGSSTGGGDGDASDDDEGVFVETPVREEMEERVKI